MWIWWILHTLTLWLHWFYNHNTKDRIIPRKSPRCLHDDQMCLNALPSHCGYWRNLGPQPFDLLLYYGSAWGSRHKEMAYFPAWSCPQIPNRHPLESDQQYKFAETMCIMPMCPLRLMMCFLLPSIPKCTATCIQCPTSWFMLLSYPTTCECETWLLTICTQHPNMHTDMKNGVAYVYRKKKSPTSARYGCYGGVRIAAISLILNRCSPIT